MKRYLFALLTLACFAASAYAQTPQPQPTPRLIALRPGTLVDSHTHLCMTVDLQRDAGNYYYTTLNDPDSFRAVQGVANARAMLEAGFTTVRDVGNEGNYACVSVARGIARGIDRKSVV